MVLIKGAGNTTVVFLSTPISTRDCRFRSCRANGWAIMVSEASPRAVAARFAFSGDNLGPLLTLGLGLPRHRPLHPFGELDILQLDEGHLHAPGEGERVQDLPDIAVDALGLGQRLVQAVPADHLPEGGLGDLVDRRRDVFDGDY